MSHVSLEIAVQPPAMAQRGAVLDPPLMLVMRIGDDVNGHSEDLSQIWAFATLINQNGEIASGPLRGSLAESAQPFTNSDNSMAYFLFENLSVYSLGFYRLRATLMRMDSDSSATTLQQSVSRIIAVVDEDVQYQAPSTSEQEFLDSLPK